MGSTTFTLGYYYYPCLYAYAFTMYDNDDVIDFVWSYKNTCVIAAGQNKTSALEIE